MDVECHRKILNDQVEFENITLIFGQNKRVGCGWRVFTHRLNTRDWSSKLKVSCNEKIADDVSHSELLNPILISINTTIMIRCGV